MRQLRAWALAREAVQIARDEIRLNTPWVEDGAGVALDPGRLEPRRFRPDHVKRVAQISQVSSSARPRRRAK